MKTDTLSLADALELFAGGEVVPVAGVEVTALREADGGPVLEVRLAVELDFFQWVRLDGGPAFGLERWRGLPHHRPRLDPAQSVRLEARLSAGVLRALGPAPDLADVAAALGAGRPDSTLRQTESWQVTSLTQALQPGLRGGFSAED